MSGAAVDAPILIAGGGIGGLTAALALARVGRRSVVLERSPAIREIGAGIQLGPNAFRVFDALGIRDAVDAVAVPVERLRLMNAVDGGEVCAIGLGDAFRRRFGAPYAVVHRAELHASILRACRETGAVALRPGAEIVGYEAAADGVCARVAGGETVTGAMLVGADGLRSRIRRQLVGDGDPRVSGHTTYRSVVPRAAMPEDLRRDVVTLWAGPKCHLVHYPLSGGEAFNLVATRHDDAPHPAAGQPAAADEVRAGFARVHASVRRVIGIGRDWRKWVLCDRDPIAGWTDGRVALLGDAAHPTLQYLAQGACMAMEDAVALADELARSPGDPAAASLRYQRRRLLRTARVTLQSRQVGEHVYHAAGVHAALRDELMRARSQDDWLDAMGWLYDRDAAGPATPPGRAAST